MKIFGTKSKFFGTKLNFFDIRLTFFGTKLIFFGTKLKFFGTKLKFRLHMSHRASHPFTVFYMLNKPRGVNIKYTTVITARSSHQEMFCEKDVHRNFVKLTGKHLCVSFFLNKVAGLRLANLL